MTILPNPAAKRRRRAAQTDVHSAAPARARTRHGTTEDDANDTANHCQTGQELRRARDTNGWTRKELAGRLPFPIHIQTLAGYEHNTVQCTVNRFIKLCKSMGVPAPDVLAWAMQRGRVNLELIGVQVDLHAIIKDKTPELLPLRRWARKRLAGDPGADVVRLTWPVVQEMATLFGFHPAWFVECLIGFTPGPVPQRR